MGVPAIDANVFDGRYEILAIIGRGRTSIVYQARRIHAASDSTANQYVALKLISGNPRFPGEVQQRVRREGLAMLAARHPNVVRLMDFVVLPESSYLTMEYANRGDLLRESRRNAELPRPEIVLRYVAQVLDGLEAVHRAGMIHRDIKPENILLTSDGTTKIADFSLAKLPGEEISVDEASLGVGTFDYLSPEILEQSVITAQSDIYAVGITLYQLLTKELPFPGNSITEHLESKLRGNLIPLNVYGADFPAHLEDLIRVALRPNPTERFESATAFRLAIEDFLEDRWEPPTSGHRRSIASDPSHEPDDFREWEDESLGLDAQSEAIELQPAPNDSDEYTHQSQPNIESFFEASDARPSFLSRSKKRFLMFFGLIALGAYLYFVPESCLHTPLQCLIGSSSPSASVSSRQQSLHSSEGPATSVLDALLAERLTIGDPQKPTSLFEESNELHTGVLYAFGGPTSHRTFSLSRLGKSDYALFAIKDENWRPRRIPIPTLLSGTEVVIEQRQARLRIWVDESVRPSSKAIRGALRGRYREEVSGAEGYWILW